MPLGNVQAPVAWPSGAGISQTTPAVLWTTEDPDPYGENPSARLPELAGRVVYLVGFAETKIDRTNEQSPILDLIHSPAATGDAAAATPCRS